MQLWGFSFEPSHNAMLWIARPTGRLSHMAGPRTRANGDMASLCAILNKDTVNTEVCKAGLHDEKSNEVPVL